MNTINIPVLALRGMTAFPGETVSFDVEREISIFALDNAMEGDRRLFLVTQRKIGVSEPEEQDLYEIGTVCHVLQIIKTSETTVRVLVEGEQRARLHRLWQASPFLQANVELLEDAPYRSTSHTEALLRQTYAIFGAYKELSPQMSDEVVAQVLDQRDPGRLADFIAQNLTLRHQDRQRVLDQLHPVKRLQLVNDILTHEVDVMGLEFEMEQKVRQRVAQVQKDMILREQLKVLQHELGEDGDEELSDYEARITALHLPEELHRKLMKEVDRLAKQPFGSAEGSVIRNYLDVCLELPWGKYTHDRADVAQARRILDRDHFGLEKVKERILETIAVRQRLLPENGAISQIAMSAMDDWGGCIAEQDPPALVIIEGLTMYLTETDVQRIFSVIAGRFQSATVLAETMNPMVVKRFREKSIEGSHAKFTWGVKNGAALAALLPEFRLREEHSLTEGMAEFVPVYKLLGKIPAIRNISNKIIVLERK